MSRQRVWIGSGLVWQAARAGFLGLCLGSLLGPGLAVGAVAAGSEAPPTQIAQSGQEADTPPQLPERFTREEVRDLISRLSDEEARQLLLRQLDKVALAEAAPEPETGGFVDNFEDTLQRAHDRLSLMLAAVSELPSLGSHLLDRLTEGEGRGHIWTLLFITILIFAGGIVGEWAFRRLFTRISDASDETPLQSIIDRLCILSIRLLADVLAIAVFGLAAAGLFFAFYLGHEPTRQLIAAIFWAVIIVRLAAAVARLALAPGCPWLRIPPLDDPTAKTVYRRFVLIVGVIVGAVYLNELLAGAGLGAGLVMLLGVVMSFLVLAVIVVVLLLEPRESASNWMTKPLEGSKRNGVTTRNAWPIATSWSAISVSCSPYCSS